ncbi:MAG: hypothetical protein ABIW49_08580 [Knoellia sp.]
MEIIDYFRILRRRLLVIVLVPLVAVGSAVAWALLRPPTYAGVATINGTALVGTTSSQFTGPQGVGQFVSAFGAAASGPYVLNVVSARTSITVRDLRDGLVVTQVGDSSTMRVAYESGKRETVEPVLTAVVKETLVALFRPRADQSIRDRDAAAKEVETANAEAEALAAKVGRANPRETYQALVSKISNLEQQQATLRANGNAVGAAVLNAPLKAAQTEAAGYGPILADFATVEAKQQATADALASAQQEYRLATGQLTATASDRVVFISGVSSAAASTAAWSLVLPVLGAGIFGALVVVFILELLGRSRAQGRRGLGDSAAETEVDEVVVDRAGPVMTDPPGPTFLADSRSRHRTSARNGSETVVVPDDRRADHTLAEFGEPRGETDAGEPAPEPSVEQARPAVGSDPDTFSWEKGHHGAVRATRQPRRR